MTRMHTETLLFSRLLHRRYLVSDLLLNAQPIVVIGTNLVIDVGPQLCSDLGGIENERWFLGLYFLKQNAITDSKTSYSSPIACFSFPLTQLTHTPGPSIGPRNVPSW